MEEPDFVESGARWMTYRELATALSISLPAAEARARRGKWRKQKGSNDGALRVSVPLDALLPPPTPAQGPQVADLLAELKAAHEAMVAELKTVHGAAVEELRRRAGAAEADAKAERALAEKRAEELAATVQKLGAALRQAEDAEKRTEEAAAALAGWTEGNLFKRALRALLWRRG